MYRDSYRTYGEDKFQSIVEYYTRYIFQRINLSKLLNNKTKSAKSNILQGKMQKCKIATMSYLEDKTSYQQIIMSH